ncbi:hypothetical protein BGZ47_001005 [Haplosporangium gracile]|nr:hypothetical protein BGZ47_001005 [Haplosporangium gracile]
MVATTTTTHRPKAEPLYHDMKAIQMRPYGHEDNDDDGYNRFEQHSLQEDPGLQEQGYEDGNGGYDYYYDELSQLHHQRQHQYDQQQGDVSAGFYESPSSSATSFLASATTPSKTQSQDSLAKKASLAKAKFYKYLNKPTASSSYSSFSFQHKHHPLDSGSSDPESTGHHHRYQHGYYESEGDGHDSSHQFGSGCSFTSSLRARVRLTRTKTVLRQVKRRLSKVLSHLGKKSSPNGMAGDGEIDNDFMREEQLTHAWQDHGMDRVK